MAYPVITIPPLDPNLYTGPVRKLSGPARTRDVVLDTWYGEFADWLYVGVSGDISYVQWDGTTQVLVGLAAGVWHPIHSIMVNSVGTTATDIVRGS